MDAPRLRTREGIAEAGNVSLAVGKKKEPKLLYVNFRPSK
jgi:hypothetical protein